VANHSQESQLTFLIGGFKGWNFEGGKSGGEM
jgi:hypothetical protein